MEQAAHQPGALAAPAEPIAVAKRAAPSAGGAVPAESGWWGEEEPPQAQARQYCQCREPAGARGLRERGQHGCKKQGKRKS